ncbi:MAG: cytochrome P450 [Myxococcales bacterium]|nr:cytochrome P450 [Myxococcales bacterium]
MVDEADTTDDGEPVEVKGRWYSRLSPQPLLQMKPFLTAVEDYVRDRRTAAGGAPVFRAHPGLRSVILTDHVSGSFFITAGEELLEREPYPRFGPIATPEELTGGSAAALISHGAVHRRSRAFAAAVLGERREAWRPSLEAAVEGGVADWLASGSVALDAEVQRVLSRFAFRWILDVAPDDADVRAWQDNITTLVTDSYVANLIARFTLPRLPEEAVRAAGRLVDVARSSPHLGRLRALGREHGVDGDELLHQLVFLCAFNIGGGISRFATPGLLRVAADPALGERLRGELSGWTWEDDGERPLLDAVLLESLRLFPQPRFLHRQAVRDFILPSAAGRFRIHRGDLLVALMPMIHRDPTVFADADRFAPQRFLDDPSLGEKVMTFGWAPATRHEFHCLGRHAAQAVWRQVAARLFSGFTWRTPTLDFHVNHVRDVDPVDVVLEEFTARGEASEGGSA